MPKKFTNVIDRGRVTANKYNLTNNGDGTAIITDIESNINVPGTPLNKELFNPMQEGLIFTVETVHTIENSTDVYELEIDGLQGTSNLNGMPLFKGLSFNIKISETNTTNVVKIKISGNKYDLAKESGDTVVNLTVGELKRNRYYKVIFDSVRFTIPVEIIEYNPMFGANFGGLLGTPGTKKVGVAYYDVANNQTVVPTVENNLTYFESSKFIPISDYQTAKKLENLFETHWINLGNNTPIGKVFETQIKVPSKPYKLFYSVFTGGSKFIDLKVATQYASSEIVVNLGVSNTGFLQYSVAKNTSVIDGRHICVMFVF
jgi:hypothetical protein